MASSTEITKRWGRIKWSALTGIARGGAVALITIFSAPITINYLGKEYYAVWVIVTSFLIWAQLFDFGILNGLTNALSEAFGRDDYESAKQYVSTCFYATLLIAGIGIIAWAAVSLHIPWEKFIRVENERQAFLLGKGICIVGIFFLLSIPFLLVTRILHAYQRQYFAHGMHFVSYLLTLLSLIIGVHYRYDFLQLLVAIHLIPLVWQMLCWYLVARKIPWAGFARKSVRVSALKRIAQSSVPLLVLQLINVLASQIIPILLAAVTTLKEVADFTILWKIFLFIFFTMSNIASAYLPGIRDAFERGEMAWIKRAIKYLLLLQMGIIAVGCLPLLFAGNEIITVWIRMPLEKPLANGEWLLYSCCILFGVLNSTLNAILLILDKIALQIVLALVSNALVIASIAWGVSHRGLIVIFTVMALTALISLYYSFRQLKRDILA